MPGINVNISFDSHEVDAMITSYQKVLPEVIEAWMKNEVTRIMRDSFEKNFEAEGRPEPWAELAESTVARRGSAHPILEVTGDLRREVTEAGHPAHFEQIIQNTDGVILEMGATSGKFRKHQKGGFGSFGQMIPKRKMVVIQQDDAEEIGESLDSLIGRFR